MKKGVFKKILGGLSLTTVMFAFQACYGTPQDFGRDLLVKGQVKSKTSGEPIKGIKVSVMDNRQYEMTDEEGRFSFYTERSSELRLQFQDVDGEQNKLYADKDTVLTSFGDRVDLAVALDEK